jgi:hypothetical protein
MEVVTARMMLSSSPAVLPDAAGPQHSVQEGFQDGGKQGRPEGEGRVAVHHQLRPGAVPQRRGGKTRGNDQGCVGLPGVDRRAGFGLAGQDAHPYQLAEPAQVLQEQAAQARPAGRIRPVLVDHGQANRGGPRLRAAAHAPEGQVHQPGDQ